MQRHLFGNRTEAPAFFDMACRFRPRRAFWYGKGFRIGDRAAAYVYLHDWRKRHPNRRLVVIESNLIPATGWSKYLPCTWMFKDIADEVWVLEERDTHVAQPPGTRLYNQTMWRIWQRFRYEQPPHLPPIPIPTPSALSRAIQLREQLGVPNNYVTLQPLFDANYETARNASPRWWRVLASHLAEAGLPIVVLGAQRNTEHLAMPDECYKPYAHGVNPMESLALIYGAQLHIGGETGTTLWAPILRVPTAAVYRRWSSEKGTDTRPLDFGRGVVYCPLGQNITAVSEAARQLAPHMIT